MEFNKITRGHKRQENDVATVYEILDAGFVCTVAFCHENVAMQIPTGYGRIDDVIYLHGSRKNFMLNTIANGQTISIGVTHTDGIVLARSLFDTSINYRSVVLFGKAEIVEDEEEWLTGLKIITDNIIPGRWEEVPTGKDSQLKATMVVKMKIDRASAKVRNEGPAGDDSLTNLDWSGHIPLVTKALEPIQDMKFGDGELPQTESVKQFVKQMNGE